MFSDAEILEFFFRERSKFDELENLRKFANAAYERGKEDALEAGGGGESKDGVEMSIIKGPDGSLQRETLAIDHHIAWASIYSLSGCDELLRRGYRAIRVRVTEIGG